MNVTFISSVKNPRFFRRDPAFIYRCENLAAVFAKSQGNPPELKHISRLGPLNTYQRGDVLVFHRPRFSWRLWWIIWRLRRQGVVLLADFDDCIFDPAHAGHSPRVVNRFLTPREVQRSYRQHQRAIRFFDSLTVSTEPLKSHLFEYYPDKKVRVLTNAVHVHWQRDFSGEPISSHEKKLQNPLITYLPGTRSHDRDFVVFANDLARFLNDHPRVKLQITGPLNFDLPVRREQLVCREKVPFSEYHHEVRAGWVNLAPLEDTPFNRCKSALKIMEAAYWYKPTLCTVNPDVERFIGAGAIPVNGDLYAQLQRLLDPLVYEQETRNLRERMLPLADGNTVAQQFLDFVGEHDQA